MIVSPITTTIIAMNKNERNADDVRVASFFDPLRLRSLFRQLRLQKSWAMTG